MAARVDDPAVSKGRFGGFFLAGSGPGSLFAWALLTVLMLTQAMSFMDRMAWTVAIPVVVPLLKISMTEAGAMVTAFYVGTTAAQIPGGWLADRFGPRRVLAFSLVLLGFFTAITGLGRNMNELLALRFLAGVFSGALFSCNMKYQLGWFPKSQRGKAMGYYMLGPSLGTSLTNAILPAILLSMGWQAIFVFPGIATIVVAVIVFAMAKETGLARPAAQVKADAAQAATAAPGSSAAAPSASGTGGTVWYRNPSFVLGCTVGFFNLAVSLGISTWTVAFLTKGVGFPLVLAGAMMATYSVLAMVGTFTAGFAVDFLRSRKRVLYIGFGISIPIMAATGLAGNPSETLMWVLVLTSGFFGAWCQVPLIAMQNEIAAGPQSATAMGSYNFICQLGSTIAPIMLGFVLDISGVNYMWLWLTLAGIRIIGLSFVWLMRERGASEGINPALAH